MTELINGINLQQAANYVWDADRRDDISSINTNTVIWCKTDYIRLLFEKIKHVNYGVVLITHCSDHSITKDIFDSRPTCVRKWFAQNADYEHIDLIPIPIGIENHKGVNKGSSVDINAIESSSFDFEIKNKIINKLYCNFNLHNHHNRLHVSRTLYGSNMAVSGDRCSYSSYLQELKKFLFIASPRGNGIDCHRTWEALYCGSIPIVDKHFMYDTYNELPIIQVSSWSDVGISMLAPYVHTYKNRDAFNNINKIKLTYWIELIKSMLIKI
jgi:hypothetical protein